MKMPADTFAQLRTALLAVLDAHPGFLTHYAERGLPLERACWDLLHFSRFPTEPLYRAGLKDAHINTALLRIVLFDASRG